MTPPGALERPRPQSLSDLFFSFSLLALQGFGGVLAIVQREMVEKKRWLTREEFIEDWAVAQVMPGPNVVNLSLMIGARHFGLPGALSALAGMMVFPLIAVLLLTLLYTHYANHPGVAGALRGMGAVAAGMIAGSGLRLLSALKSSPLGRPLCLSLAAATFIGVALLHLPIGYVLFALGSIGCIAAYRKLKP